MKKLVMTAALILTVLPVIQAQRKADIESLRVAIYTRELNLSSQEAQVFWPIYNEYQDKQEDLKRQMRIERMKFEGKDRLSDSEAEKLIDMVLDFEQKELNLKKEFTNKLKNVIPVQKVVLIPKAERAFKEALLREIKDK